MHSIYIKTHPTTINRLWKAGAALVITISSFKVIKPRTSIFPAHLTQSETKQFHSFLLTTRKKVLKLKLRTYKF